MFVVPTSPRRVSGFLGGGGIFTINPPADGTEFSTRTFVRQMSMHLARQRFLPYVTGMGIEKVVFLAVLIAVFQPAAAATSTTYDGACTAWKPDGQVSQSGPCVISVGVVGMTKKLSYQIQFQGLEIDVELSPGRCRVAKKSCVFYANEFTKMLRVVSVDRAVFEFTSPPADSF